MKKLLFTTLLALYFSMNIFSSNFLGNGDFESGAAIGSSYWGIFASNAANHACSIIHANTISGNYSFKDSIITPEIIITRLGIGQSITLPKAAVYTVTFKARASVACQLSSSLGQSFSPYLSLVTSPTFNLTTAVTTYSYDISITSNSTGFSKLNFNYGTAPAGTTVYIDDCSVVEKKTLTDKNLCNGDFETSMNNGIYAPGNYTYNGITTGVAGGDIYYGWSLDKYTTHTADVYATIDNLVPISGSQSIRLTSIGTPTSVPADMMFCWMFSGQKDMYYTVSFKAKATTNCSIYVGLATQNATKLLGDSICNLTSAVKTYSYTSTVPFGIVADGRTYLKFLLGTVPKDVSIWIDDVSLVRSVPVAAVSVSPSPVTIAAGYTFQLAASVTPVDAANQGIVWASSDVTKATVGSTGLVTGIAAGAVNITATSKDKGQIGSAALTISASAVAVTGIAVTPSIVTINKGSTQQLSTMFTPIGASNKTVSWKSDNDALATVDANGLVTGLVPGTAIVSATTQDGAYIGSATISVVIPVTACTLPSTTTPLAVGTTFQLNPVVAPVNAFNKTVSYSSNKPTVATVSAIGLVSGVTIGSAIVSATTQDGSYTATDTVYVYSSLLKLPTVISSNMVMQQDMQAALWGWGPPNESVSITPSWGSAITTTANSNGKWSTKIQTPKAIAGNVPPKYTISFVGKNNSILLTNILIGDVYLCSGQSNMAFVMDSTGQKGVLNFKSEIAAANYPYIRLNKPSESEQSVPMDDNVSSWLECNPASIANFPAVPYYFARELHLNSNINIPIGVLVSAKGGSCCQSWTRREALAKDSMLKTTYLDPYDLSLVAKMDVPTACSILYNGMIAPLVPFSIKGFLWYQGEANDNLSMTKSYSALNMAMIKDWRALWGQGDLPFYYVQLPAYTNFHADFRDQQSNVLTLHNTGMAVTMDLADADLTNIHPRNKKEVAKRLARIAEANIYGQNITYAGPIFKSKSVEANKIRISFYPSTVGAGLANRNGQALSNFQIAGGNNTYVDATAVIDGNDVLVSAGNVLNPVNVSFAYSGAALPNLMNKDSLTACPFRTDTWNNSISFGALLTENEVLKSSVSSEMVSVYPVPVRDVLHVDFQKSVGKVHIELLDVTGQIHYSKISDTDMLEKQINVAALPKGLYFLKVVGKEFNFSKSIVIL